MPGATRIYVADIPGIIEGAHENRGLGLEFLRHIERTSLLMFVLDASGIDGRTPASDLKVLRKELKAYNPKLLERPSLLVLNKIDDEACQEHLEDFKKKFPKEKPFLISAITGEGLKELTAEINRLVAR